MEMTVRRFAPYAVTALALLALALLIVKLAPVLLLAFAGIVIAAVIHTAAAPLMRRLHLPSPVAVGLVALVLGALVAGGLWLFGKQVVGQAAELWSAVQEASASVRERIADYPLLQAAVDELHSATNPETMNRVAKGTLTAFGVLVDIVLVLFLAVYLAMDPASYRNGLVRLFPKAARPRLASALEEAGHAMRKWLLGQLFAMLCVGTLTAIGLLFVGVPLAIPLGILLGIMDFVPVVGPFIAAIPGVLIAFAQSPQLALYAALVYAVMQFVEGHFIMPLAQRWAVSIPPAVTLLGIVAFGALLGPMGVLLAMPLIVVTMTLVNKLYVEPLK
jgi:predicted PurR-regulated permease PerM